MYICFIAPQLGVETWLLIVVWKKYKSKHRGTTDNEIHVIQKLVSCIVCDLLYTVLIWATFICFLNGVASHVNLIFSNKKFMSTFSSRLSLSFSPSFNICFLLPSFSMIVSSQSDFYWKYVPAVPICATAKCKKITLSIVRHPTIIFHLILWALLVTLRSINYILLCVFSL